MRSLDSRRLQAGLSLVLLLFAASSVASCGGETRDDSPSTHWRVPPLPADRTYPKEIGRGSPLVRELKGRTEIWIRGPLQGEGSDWLDVSDAGFVAERMQYGYGADRLPPIESPRYLPGDDGGWSDLALAETRYGDLRLRGDTELIALDFRGEMRAYPLAVLHEHELVLDEFAGVPVAVAY